MKVSVVIPTVKRPDALKRAVESVLACDPSPDEIVVVDQTPATRDCVGVAAAWDDGRVVYLNDSGIGAARARNVGWLAARGELIAFTDDDAQVAPEWVGAVIDAFGDGRFRIGVLGGKIVPSYIERVDGWHIPRDFEYILPAADAGHARGHYRQAMLPASVNFSVRREVLEAFGGFDERLGPGVRRRTSVFGEDSDLAQRVRRAGYDLIYDPGVVVYHPVPRERQTIAYLQRRMHVDGATTAFRNLIVGEASTTAMIRQLWKSLRELAKLRRDHRNQDDLLLRSAHTWRELGKLDVAVSCLLRRPGEIEVSGRLYAVWKWLDPLRARIGKGRARNNVLDKDV